MEPESKDQKATTSSSDTSILKPLQTYERDIAELISAHQVNAVSVNLAATKKREEEKEREKRILENKKLEESKPFIPLVNSNKVPDAPKAPQDSLIKVEEPRNPQIEIDNIVDKKPQQDAIPKSVFTPQERIVRPAAQKLSTRDVIYTRQDVKGSGKNKFLIVFGFILIIGGILALGYLLFNYIGTKQDTNTVIVAPVKTSLIPPDTTTSILVTNSNPRDIANAFRGVLAQNLADPSLLKVSFTDTQDSAQKEISAETFFNVATQTSPDRLARSFREEMFAGIYAQGDKHPLFIFKIENFDTAYDGMLTWEKTMYQDFESFIRTEKVGEETIATLPAQNFIDVIIANKDCRVLKDGFGNDIIVYSFIDQETLIIADSEETFKEIVARYTSSQLIR
jgi:hypothetical protein